MWYRVLDPHLEWQSNPFVNSLFKGGVPIKLKGYILKFKDYRVKIKTTKININP